MTDHFFTISTNGTGLYKEKGSKFLGFSYPVQSLQHVNERLAELRKEYHDARHHCYAYMLGAESKDCRANDDGEPNHSAGDPILGQIRSLKLTNTLVVVVRYFGGTKLGVSGLIHAYKIAAEAALKNSTVAKKYITVPLHISYNYTSTNEVMKLIDLFNLNIINQEFSERCSLEATIVISNQKQALKELKLLIDTGHDIQIL
ncbi:MAG: YigZ family protein [Cyclobacteriaceae bacterium]|nr:YigZ family protein [Cyclobacteriaceae bacterium]